MQFIVVVNYKSIATEPFGAGISHALKSGAYDHAHALDNAQ